MLVVGWMVGMVAVAAPGPEPEPDPPPTATPVEGAGPCPFEVTQGGEFAVGCGQQWVGDSLQFDMYESIGRACVDGECAPTLGDVFVSTIFIGDWEPGYQYVFDWSWVYSGSGTLHNCRGLVTDEGCCVGDFPVQNPNPAAFRTRTLCL